MHTLTYGTFFIESSYVKNDLLAVYLYHFRFSPTLMPIGVAEV
jgi:hypothetical protein